MKKIFKSRLLLVIVTMLLSITGSILATTTILSEQVSYNNEKTTETTVKGSLDELFSAVDINNRLGNDDISGIGNGTITGAISSLNNKIYYNQHASLDGTSFGNDLCSFDPDNKEGILNRSSYFDIYKDEIDNWSNVPDNMITDINSYGAIVGYREVYMRASWHVLIKVTELYPIPGRTWTNFYNSGKWTGWSIHN